MKKSTRKIISYLSKYIGFEVIRTKPAGGDWSYTSEPILLVGFTKDGRIKYRHKGVDAKILGNKVFVLSKNFTDRNWITYKKALQAEHNQLNQWRGKKIKRIRPTAICGDHSFMCESYGDKAPTLISASKYHMVIQYNDILLEGHKSVLRSEYINPEDWVLAE